MDLPSLALILQGALSPNPSERKAAEESLNQVLRYYFSSKIKIFVPFSQKRMKLDQVREWIVTIVRNVKISKLRKFILGYGLSGFYLIFLSYWNLKWLDMKLVDF